MSMDPVLLDACGDVLAAQFAGVTKVLTGHDHERSCSSCCAHARDAPSILTLETWPRDFHGDFYKATCRFEW